MDSPNRPAFRAAGISKRYGDVVALAPLDIEIGAGETVAIVGPSGAGKTTLLYLLAGILEPSEGSIAIYGRPMRDVRSPGELARLVGVMHQHFDLVPSLGVVHNVLAGRLGDWSLLKSLVSLVSPQDLGLARTALERVGIGDKIRERTSRLSGGQQQRVALARLLVQNPKAILADEPVSALDPARAEDMVRMLIDVAGERERSLVVSLHAVPLALRYFQRIIAIRQGSVAFDRPAEAVSESSLTDLYTLDDGSLSHGNASQELPE